MAMPREVVWTSGAESDLLRLYEQMGNHDLALRVLRDPLERSLHLLADNPGLGPVVKGTRRVRRLLTGPRLRFGLFYVEETTRIMIHALVDMRDDPSLVRRRLRELE